MFIDSKFLLMGTSFWLILMDLTPIKYSADFSPAKELPAVLTGLISKGVKEKVTPDPGTSSSGPYPKKATPFGDEERQR